MSNPVADLVSLNLSLLVFVFTKHNIQDGIKLGIEEKSAISNKELYQYNGNKHDTFAKLWWYQFSPYLFLFIFVKNWGKGAGKDSKSSTISIGQEMVWIF